MAILYRFDKRSRVTYVYESKSYRDPITKQPRSHRKLIGKLDDQGNIVATRKKSRSNTSTTERVSSTTSATTSSITPVSVQRLIDERDQEIVSLKRKLNTIEQKLQRISSIVNE